MAGAKYAIKWSEWHPQIYFRQERLLTALEKVKNKFAGGVEID